MDGGCPGSGRVPQLPPSRRHRKPAEKLLVERANMLTLTAPEMTVLVGGMRQLTQSVPRPSQKNANHCQAPHESP